MKFKRASGILLHPTSLPGPFGIGDLGIEAYKLVDFLAESGQKLWQVLPLNPTGYGNSPYASFSAFAGNPLLLSPEYLIREGFLEEADIEGLPEFSTDRVDYEKALPFKEKLFGISYERFKKKASTYESSRFMHFCKLNHHWLHDYALFMAIKSYYQQEGKKEFKSWLEWEKEIVIRHPHALNLIEQKLEDQIYLHKYLQYQFVKQWLSLKDYANKNNVQLVGDIPIFVAFDSADVWSNPEIFQLDHNLSPQAVAGVPPDYFSKTGQLWGNPLYNWRALKNTGYRWWIHRLKLALSLVDIVRLDHFRGFEAYWSIPYGSQTAINGSWKKGPGASLFRAFEEALGDLPLIAEDLGVITPEVEKLRDRFSLPGMKILQFAFNTDGTNDYLPHNFDKNCVVYPGTHDNDTTQGWFDNGTPKEKKHAQEYTGANGTTISWAFIRLALASVAHTAIFAMPDVLDLGTEARMNTPSVEKGNWIWRMVPGMLNGGEIQKKLKHLVEIYGRG